MAFHLAALFVAGITFTSPEPWALGVAAPPRIPFVGDVDADGYADLIVVYPPGDAIIDVNLSRQGEKSGGGIQALNPWGKDCQAATVGEFDQNKGTDVIGLFGGKSLRLAGKFANGRFSDTQEWLTLPSELKSPVLATIGNSVFAFSSPSGSGYKVSLSKKKITDITLPKGLVWLGDASVNLVGQNDRGDVFWVDRMTLRRGSLIGKVGKGARAAASPGLVVLGDRAWTPGGFIPLQAAKLPVVPSVFGIGDIDADGDPDLLEFRYGTEQHTGNQVLVRRFVSPIETDNDHDGLSNELEATLMTDPNRSDTDDDGLNDGWEVNGFRGLDMKAIGCDPRRVDMLCLISRFEGVTEAKVKAEMDRVIKFYADLKVDNPDGSSGLRFHPIYLPVVTGEDTKSAWWTNRAKFRDEKLRGVVHWMQITPGGGGQADQLGDGGGCGENALWAVFVHEFGHQLGLSHEGFWPNGSCPIYGSLMNYNYSYGFEDSRDKIHYSDGSLAGYVLRETNLDETVPLPYDRVKFLEKGPYNFRLKPNGSTTLIDWNWNGVFGEKNIRADINYAYSTNAGTRDDVGKSKTSPWLFSHRGKAMVLFGVNDKAADPKSDPSLSAENPGRLMMRRLQKPFAWDKPWTLDAKDVIGDPVGFSFAGKVRVLYPTTAGVVMRSVEFRGKDDVTVGEASVVSSDATLVPTVGEVNGRPHVMLWNPANGGIRVRPVGKDGALEAGFELEAKSTNPPGVCFDTVTKQVVVAMAQNQGEAKPNRWQVRRYRVDKGVWVFQSVEWVEGEGGGTRGSGRLTALFERSRDTGPAGRLYIYGRGMTSKESPWACTYVAHQIADKTVRGGWLVKRYYDEWTQSRSAPAAAWFGGDVIWSYRWVDGGQGSTDNNLHVGYRGLGLQEEPFGDHDDIGFIRQFGIRNSILSLGVVP